MLKLVIIVGVALVIPIFFFITWFVSTHNRLITLRARLRTAFAQLHAHLKHRSDLIPDLIELSKPAFKDDMTALQDLAAARIPAAAAVSQTDPKKLTRSSVKELSASGRALQTGLEKLFTAADQKPDLRTQRLFVNLREDLDATAKAVGTVRETYNQAATEYNELTRHFPAMLIARTFGFEVAEFF